MNPQPLYLVSLVAPSQITQHAGHTEPKTSRILSKRTETYRYGEGQIAPNKTVKTTYECDVPTGKVLIAPPPSAVYSGVSQAMIMRQYGSDLPGEGMGGQRTQHTDNIPPCTHAPYTHYTTPSSSHNALLFTRCLTRCARAHASHAVFRTRHTHATKRPPIKHP